MLSSKFSILKHWHYRKILTCLGFSTNIGFFFFNHNYCYGNLLLSLIFLKRSLVFPILLFSSIFFALITAEGFLNSAFKWVYLSFSPLPFTSLLFTSLYKTSSDNHFAFLHFFFLGMILIPASCTMSRTSVHSSSGTLPIRSKPLNLFLTSTVQL